ncbi:atrial natriuretic peptide receptor 1 isoform X2 [Nematostella vectensis]|uniref:atrial natriuretic peptide receptor 1 isoform X2 n=1 Tax=Nematostella vectensis TaxID=45351 RepID=UPI0020776436|nr:atrial natriuretic peptide receptor 1 isoform X2 [Nematostella vectensis]
MSPLLLYTAVLLTVVASSRQIHLSVLLPLSDGAWEVGPVIVPTIDHALSHIRSLQLLSSYNITYYVNDSKCDSATASGITADLWASQPRPDVFIGPGCSSACLSAGLLAGYWGVPMISYSCSSSDLTNRKLYSTFVRTQPFSRSYEASTPGLLRFLMNSFNWKRAAIIANYASSGELIWEPMASSVRKEFLKYGYTVAYYKAHLSSPQQDKKDELLDLLREAKKKARIIFIFANLIRTKDFMTAARSLGMLNGSFAFIAIDFYITPDSQDHTRAFDGIITLTVNKSSRAEIDRYANDLNQSYPYLANQGRLDTSAKTAPYLYDAVLLYAHALNRTLQAGGVINDGIGLVKRMMTSSPMFEGKTGPVTIDPKGNRVPVFVFENIQNGTNVRLLTMPSNYHNMSAVTPLRAVWPGGGMEQPDDDPPCVFKSCYTRPNYVIPTTTALGVLSLLSIIGGIFFFRKRRYENDLLSRSWIINYDDIQPVNMDTRFASKVIKDFSYDNQSRCSRITDMLQYQRSSVRDVGRYKGELVALKMLRKDSLTLTRDMLIEMKQVRDIQHTNLLHYIGVCTTPPNICIVSQYCHRGSLQEILANDEISLDWFFRESFANDIAMGMHVIHTSSIHVHGDLRSSKCLIDSRWVCKVADFGLNLLKANQRPDPEIGVHAQYSRLFWRAPELLQNEKSTNKPVPTQMGDVYSFGIILNELLTREEPYATTEFAPIEVIERIRCHLNPPFRPETPFEIRNRSVTKLMTQCWNDDPQARPTFSDIKRQLRLLKEGKSSIVDNMLRLMENYTEQLETIVDERTRQLADEKAKTDELLYKMLPRYIAESLKRGEPVIAESYSSVTIFFSDIVGFTELAAASTPLQVVDLLNDLYTCFDTIIDKHDVYKVETIGDAYMVVSGLPVRNGHRHAGEIATMALNLLSSMGNFRARHLPNRPIHLRIGIHTGSCVAGVVGLKMPRYCLFGDTVNYASRMESTGVAQRIHVSPECKRALDELCGYHLQERGSVELKGKGHVTTYFLNGKDGFVEVLPDPSGCSSDTSLV